MAIEIHLISHHISFRFQKYQQQLQQRNSSHSSQFSPSSQPTDGPVTSSEQSPGDGGHGGSAAGGMGQTGAFLSSTPVKTFLLGSSSKVQYCMFFFILLNIMWTTGIQWIQQGMMNSTTAPNVWLFIAQLVEHCSTNAEAMSSNPIEAPKTFFGLNCDRLNRKHNCDDHNFFSQVTLSKCWGLPRLATATCRPVHL